MPNDLTSAGTSSGSYVVLAGGVGAARFLDGLVRAVPAADVTAIVNVGDDMEWCGLHIAPDIDTVVYTLAGQVNPERYGSRWDVAGLLGLDQVYELERKYGTSDIPVA